MNTKQIEKYDQHVDDHGVSSRPTLGSVRPVSAGLKATNHDRQVRLVSTALSAELHDVSSMETSLLPFVAPFEIGELLAGCYAIEAYVGHGSVGFVVAALDVRSDERVALKFLRPEFWDREDLVRRFRVEALSYSRIRSPHAVAILAADVLPDGTPFMVMELLSGNDLQSVLESEGPCLVRTAVDYVMQVCEGLAAVHAAGVRHFDIKPSNLFLVDAGQASEHIELIDFGLCKGSHPAETARSGDTLIGHGSPLYMSPEQQRGELAIGVRSDIWSLGCVLYELIAGEAVFAPRARSSIIVDERAVGPCLDCPAIPPALLAVIQRCLEPEPAARYGDVRELATALDAALARVTEEDRRRNAAAVQAGADRGGWPVSFDPAGLLQPAPRSWSAARLVVAALFGAASYYAYVALGSREAFLSQLDNIRALLP
jgi:serine/threonine protein kinase